MSHINIVWPERNVITPQIEKQLYNILIEPGNYNYYEDTKKLEKDLKYFNKKHKTNISIDVAYAIRIVLLRDKVIKKSYKMRLMGPKLLALYKKGFDILELSQTYDYAPYGLFRVILAAMGHSKRRIQDIGRNPEKHLDDRDLQTYKTAVENDIIGNPDDTVPAQIGSDFEKLLEKYFTKNGIKFVTQDHLVKKQMESVGRAVATPDIHFPDGISINDQKIFWVDAKSYYGGNVFYIKNSMKKQANKYNKIYGPGAFIFKRGFSSQLKVDAMLLSM